MWTLVQKGKIYHIMSRGQKWAWLDKDWASDTKLCMTGGAGGDLLVPKGIMKDSIF